MFSADYFRLPRWSKMQGLKTVHDLKKVLDSCLQHVLDIAWLPLYKSSWSYPWAFAISLIFPWHWIERYWKYAGVGTSCRQDRQVPIQGTGGGRHAHRAAKTDPHTKRPEVPVHESPSPHVAYGKGTIKNFATFYNLVQSLMWLTLKIFCFL